MFEGPTKKSKRDFFGKKRGNPSCPVWENVPLSVAIPTCLPLAKPKLAVTPEIKFSEGKHKSELKVKSEILKGTLKRMLAIS